MFSFIPELGSKLLVYVALLQVWVVVLYMLSPILIVILEPNIQPRFHWPVILNHGRLLYVAAIDPRVIT